MEATPTPGALPAFVQATFHLPITNVTTIGLVSVVCYTALIVLFVVGWQLFTKRG